MERATRDLHEEVVILNSKVAKMEAEHILELEHHAEELEIENKTLMEKLGMKRKWLLEEVHRGRIFGFIEIQRLVLQELESIQMGQHKV